MKSKIIIIFFSILLLSCSNTTNNNSNIEWVTLKIKEKNCEISFPFDTYKIHNEEYYVENVGKVFSYEVDLNSQKTNDMNLGYEFTVFEYPEFNFYKSPEIIDEFLSGTAENILIAFNASRIIEKKIDFNGFPGKELYYYMASREIYFTTRMYIINGKQYSMTVLTDKNNLVNKSITNYFNSFKILNNEP